MEVINAQIWLRDGMSDQRELQLEVYRPGCDGRSEVIVIQHEEFVAWLESRER